MKKTWLQEIKERLFTTWPGLTIELVSKLLPETSEKNSNKTSTLSKTRHRKHKSKPIEYSRNGGIRVTRKGITETKLLTKSRCRHNGTQLINH